MSFFSSWKRPHRCKSTSTTILDVASDWWLQNFRIYQYIVAGNAHRLDAVVQNSLQHMEDAQEDAQLNTKYSPAHNTEAF